MNLRFPFGLSVVALVVFGGAISEPASADPLPASSAADPTIKASSARPSPTAATVVQIALVTEAAARIAATTEIMPTPVAPITPIATAEPTPASTARIPSPPPPKPKAAAIKRTVKNQVAVKSDSRSHPESLAQNSGSQRKPQAVQVAQAVRTVGLRETGVAAWYGERYLGRRTSSGERLDSIHPTAAHRTLPLNSLARVTNLHNGRSVIVRVTDRGPVSQSLVIDMSPKAAEQLDMKTAGIVPVVVEQVVAVAANNK